MAEGEVDPGLNTDSVDAMRKAHFEKALNNMNHLHTRNLLDEVRRIFADNPNAVRFSDRKSSTIVKVPRERGGN